MEAIKVHPLNIPPFIFDQPKRESKRLNFKDLQKISGIEDLRNKYLYFSGAFLTQNGQFEPLLAKDIEIKVDCCKSVHLNQICDTGALSMGKGIVMGYFSALHYEWEMFITSSIQCELELILGICIDKEVSPYTPTTNLFYHNNGELISRMND